ncbi:hypothetical protein HRG_007421 [Hirsutella rhossiliensis]|uniref:Uncharacterized protein n=1 Tax=Hirsutella rhossiliensis TaxID=111463 RepID=A0A9P8MST7_9HYPO|nr:uncharacterized protein HRG_07421 [Hirsutella rhossiliensis]KAH0961343.1 hypothetical protein HRG_07421 [Hirsutella rhossiliensis]
MFSGEGTPSFESWIKQVEGKFEEDNDTFASEKTRINFVITRLEGTAYKTGEGRHHSLTRPFTTLAELIQVLQTAHTNPNKGADARAQLRVCKYDWKKDFNIFLGEFNSMYEAAGYQPSMQKQTLWDSLPAPVNQAVVERVYDTKVRYEDFCESAQHQVFVARHNFSEAQKKRNHSSSSGSRGVRNNGGNRNNARVATGNKLTKRVGQDKVSFLADLVSVIGAADLDRLIGGKQLTISSHLKLNNMSILIRALQTPERVCISPLTIG